MLRPLLVLAAASAPLLAQIPYGHLVVVNRSGSTTEAAMRLLDPMTGLTTDLYQPGASLAVGGGRTVAYDPAAPSVLYTTATVSISIQPTVTRLQLTGNEFTRSTINLPGMSGLPFHLRWAPGFGLLMVGRGNAGNRLYYRDLAGVVHAAPTATLLPANASDLAFLNGKAYGSSEGNGSTLANGTIVEWDLTANTDRVLGSSYPPICSLGVLAGMLLGGDDVGNVWLIDPNSGASAPFLASTLGRVNSLAVDPAGIVYLLVTSGSTCAVYSMIDLINPIFSTASIVEDLEIGISPVPTVLTFGRGCPGSNQQTPAFVQGSMPGLGTNFTVQVQRALPSSAGLLVLGADRRGDVFGPLPRPLDPLGLFGCTQYTGVLTMLFAPIGNSGDGSLTIPVPNDPGLAGLHLPMQWVIADPLANAVGAVASNGAELFVR